MTKKRVLAAASMNGGAEAIAPVVKRLKSRGSVVLVLSHGAATNSFRAMGVEPDEITDKSDSMSVGRRTARKLVDFDPHVVLTGTQIQDKEGGITPEQRLWLLSKALDLKSVAVLDTWGNYTERFSDLDTESGPTSLTIVPSRRLAYLPSKVAIMDGFAKREMLSLGFPESVLEVTGCPYFEHVNEEAAKLAPATREMLLSKPVFSSFSKDGKLIVFMSDSVERAYPNIGFTEKSVLQSFLAAVDKIAKGTGMEINVVVRPHPFRNDNARAAFEFETPAIQKALHNPVSARGDEPENDYSMEELLHSADLVVGTFNNPLITAKIMGKTVINYQPDIADGYDFQRFLCEQDMTTRVTEEGKLGDVLLSALNGTLVQKSMEAVKGAIDNVIRLL